MPNVDPNTVPLLWPVLQILGLATVLLSALIGGLWVGFKWLHGQIEETSTRIVKPVEERVALVEREVSAAHKRLDELTGGRK